jgi:hypothetical protein
MIKIRILVLLSSLIFTALAGSFAILYARGYRLKLGGGEKIALTPRGLLVANSDPSGAQVYVNGELETATNNTISLTPNIYDVLIKKDGFSAWQKRITIEKEVVSQVDAFLISLAPSFTPLTYSGIFNPQLSHDFSKIAYGVPTNGENNEKSGLWILETVNLPLGFNKDPRQITDGDLTDANWEWSPDGREILLTTKFGIFLLDTTQFTAQNKRVNVASKMEEIRLSWQEKTDKRLSSQLSQLPDEIEKIFTRNTANIKFSPDENRILYTASGSATIPEGVVKELPGASTQKETRDIKDKEMYVYDIKEDKNFKVGEAQIIYWLANSLNLLIPEEEKITITDYDGTNKQTVLAGSYTFPHAYPSTSNNRVLILTNFGGPTSMPNLYWLSLK